MQKAFNRQHSSTFQTQAMRVCWVHSLAKKEKQMGDPTMRYIMLGEAILQDKAAVLRRIADRIDGSLRSAEFSLPKKKKAKKRKPVSGKGRK